MWNAPGFGIMPHNNPSNQVYITILFSLTLIDKILIKIKIKKFSTINLHSFFFFFFHIFILNYNFLK